MPGHSWRAAGCAFVHSFAFLFLFRINHGPPTNTAEVNRQNNSNGIGEWVKATTGGVERQDCSELKLQLHQKVSWRMKPVLEEEVDISHFQKFSLYGLGGYGKNEPRLRNKG
ncbi:hypothetical protein EAF04_002959 [Stromatinia cepivora]|nr:hypothetical protein EAF04_002959 [Stromatinia cepivora]